MRWHGTLGLLIRGVLTGWRLGLATLRKARNQRRDLRWSLGGICCASDPADRLWNPSNGCERRIGPVPVWMLDGQHLFAVTEEWVGTVRRRDVRRNSGLSG